MTRRPTTSMTPTKTADLAERERRHAARGRARSRRQRIGCVRARCGRRARRPAPAAAPAPAPWRGPRRSASRPRCGRARSRSAGAPAGRAAARPCWRPKAPGRRPARRRATSPATSARPQPSRVATAICTMAPGTAMARDRQQVLQREMQADAEHQQDDADLGQLGGQCRIGDEARRERADQRRRRADSRPAAEAQAVGDRAEDKGEPQTGDDGGDQRRVMHAWARAVSNPPAVCHGPASTSCDQVRREAEAEAGRFVMDPGQPSAAPPVEFGQLNDLISGGMRMRGATSHGPRRTDRVRLPARKRAGRASC